MHACMHKGSLHAADTTESGHGLSVCPRPEKKVFNYGKKKWPMTTSCHESQCSFHLEKELVLSDPLNRFQEVSIKREGVA